MSRNINVFILCASNYSIKALKGVNIVLECIKSLNLSNVKNWDKINFYFSGIAIKSELENLLFDDKISIDGKNITVTYKILSEEFSNLRNLDTQKLIKMIPSRFNFILNENCPRADFGVRSNDLFKIINDLLLLDGYYIDKKAAIEAFGNMGYDSTYKNQIKLVKESVIIPKLNNDNNWSIFQLRRQSDDDFDREIKLALEESLKGGKIRKGPSESATKYKVGTRKIGNDGNIWIVKTASNGIQRWNKIKNNSKKKIIPKFNNKTISKKDISIEKLKQLKKKYKVSVSGSKSDLANGLWNVRRSSINQSDLILILPLLNKENKKEVEKLLKNIKDNPITNYKGLWKPLPKPISNMSREELIKNLKSFRNSWEKITQRNQDLSNERLKEESTEQLRKLIYFYYSDEGKNLAAEWLRNN